MRDILQFVCAVPGFLCTVLKKKGQSFETVCEQLEKQTVLIPAFTNSLLKSSVNII